MEIELNTAIQLVGFAALAGAAWWRLSAVEGAIDELKKELRGDINENNSLIRDQNGRISELELAHERQQGYRQGWDERGD